MSTNLFTLHIKSLAQQHHLAGITKPKHPLFSILRFEDFPRMENKERIKFISEFYQITLKINCPCKLKYGQNEYDFDEGVMSFFSPRQVSIIEPGDVFPDKGWLLLIHPDFLRRYPLGHKIKNYGYFEYAINESLILSDEEQVSIDHIFKHIEKEYQLPIDSFSQDVVITSTDLLLTYCNRYYNRQFITRKTPNSELLSKVERILTAYVEDSANKGLPAASYLADHLNISPKYLSDCLKQLTGQTTQQLLQGRLIDLAKDILSTTELSISETAYRLGFEYPQSFNKLFKSKTSQTPKAFRKSFN